MKHNTEYMSKYNLDLLKEQCGYDKTFFNEMVDIFIKSLMEGVEKLEESEQKNDRRQLTHYAHKILSPCKHIDAEDLIPLLKEIEDKAETSGLDDDRASYLVENIRKNADELVKHLRTEYMS
jgi:HPt (histidine-containing phosphotransfer) domain-containing protein